AGIEGAPYAPVAFDDTLYAFEIPGGTDGVKLRFEFVSDGGWDDADGEYCSTYGAIGLDDIVLSGGVVADYDFEENDEGFVAEHCPGIGDWVAVHDVSNYTILDPCDCDLENYVLAFHDETYHHGDPAGDQNQWNMAVSPIIDRTAYPAADYNKIFATFDIYGVMPRENGVLYRSGWFYEPWECEFTGALGWSPRTGDSNWLYLGAAPLCYKVNSSWTDEDLPGTADYYRFCVELMACCLCFGINDCTGESNETPLFDNFRVAMTHNPVAPPIRYGEGCYYNDAFSQSMFLYADEPGRCDSWVVEAGAEPPYILGDSLAITGPPVWGTTSSWEAHLWFRIPRVGPEIDAGDYSAWKNRLPGDPEAGFVAVRMDSCQTILPYANKMCSYFHESTMGFNPAYGDLTDENEILPDDLFTPGTLIQYFVTANYIGNNEVSFVDDTSGGFFRKIDILPSMREDPITHDIVWPTVLYVDAYNLGAEKFIQPALNSILPEIPGVGPNFDQYDEYGSTTHFNGNSIYRIYYSSNNGATLPQLLSYNTIFVNTGDLSAGAMEESDMIGLEDWLLTTIMGAFEVRQGLIMNGNQMAAIIEYHRPSFLHNTLGAELECSPYSAPDCPEGTPEDDSYCVQIIDAEGSSFPTAMDLYGYGNGCPLALNFSVLSPSGTGLGNRSWFDYDLSGPKGVVDYAQIVHENLGLANYRSTIEGYSYHRITRSFDSELGQCFADSAGIVSAIASEIWGTLDWVANGPPAGVPDPDAVETAVNRLFQNRPNPFNPRTVISFSVARKSRVELAIYDVSGRLVRQLLDKTVDAGLQNITWDGTDNWGHQVGCGVYWSQLTINDYKSTKRMVLLK
ncbi:MAG: T9SS type A sorting domain-containing protein, partial [Candidatus Eisenbacteria bacterium]|nr:T9SS type A sorting domain-containing protein [Candidatus Eisenbacteria bacterium]